MLIVSLSILLELYALISQGCELLLPVAGKMTGEVGKCTFTEFPPETKETKELLLMHRTLSRLTIYIKKIEFKLGTVK